MASSALPQADSLIKHPAFVQFWFRIMLPRQRRKADLVHNMMVDLRQRHQDRSD